MSQANVSFVQSMYAAFGQREIATIVNACAPNVDWEMVGRPSDYPGFGARKGRKGVEEFFGTVADNLDFKEFSPKEFYPVEDKVFVLGSYAMDMRKTGRAFKSDWVHIFTIRDGQVVSFREFTDTAQAAEAYRG